MANSHFFVPFISNFNAILFWNLTGMNLIQRVTITPMLSGFKVVLSLLATII
jgi:hypothetical protein